MMHRIVLFLFASSSPNSHDRELELAVVVSWPYDLFKTLKEWEPVKTGSVFINRLLGGIVTETLDTSFTRSFFLYRIFPLEVTAHSSNMTTEYHHCYKQRNDLGTYLFIEDFNKEMQLF
jgi:hypothetical protein